MTMCFVERCMLMLLPCIESRHVRFKIIDSWWGLSYSLRSFWCKPFFLGFISSCTHQCHHPTPPLLSPGKVVGMFSLGFLNPFTASCENAMTLPVPGIPASCEKFPHSNQLNFWSTESIFNQFSVFLKTLNALCVCLQYKHPRSIKRVIRSDKPVTFLLLWSHKRDIGAEPRSRIIATSAVKGVMVPDLAASLKYTLG
jgi:hypothetical protein